MSEYKSKNKVIDIIIHKQVSNLNVNVSCWESLSIKDRDFLLQSISNCQTSMIRVGAAREEDIKLDWIGQIKIKPNRRKALDIRKEELMKRGRTNVKGMNDEDREEVNKVVANKLAESIMKSKLDSKNNNGTLNIKKSLKFSK